LSLDIKHESILVLSLIMSKDFDTLVSLAPFVHDSCDIVLSVVRKGRMVDPCWITSDSELFFVVDVVIVGLEHVLGLGVGSETSTFKFRAEVDLLCGISDQVRAHP